ncbi:MAG: pyruvate, water dikinase [Myxococcales bacterium]|nr:MAG: pyruvate, water dikinase [Myxococcales bacterium]
MLGTNAMDDAFAFRRRYETFRSLLKKNSQALQLLADLEADLNFMEHTHADIRRPLWRLVDETLLMAQELNLLSNDRHKALYAVIEDIEARIRSMFDLPATDPERPLAVALGGEPGKATLIGGKAAGLTALMEIAPEHVPPGFVITTAAYRLFIDENRLTERIRLLVDDLGHVKDPDLFRSRLRAARELFINAQVPDPIRAAIATHAAAISDAGHDRWAVRSSAIQEDEDFTFAGQFDSILDVPEAYLVEAYKRVLASRFSERAMAYRLHHGFREIDTSMAVLFMPLVGPRFAGVLYTNTPTKADGGGMLINAVPGLAHEMIKGKVQADTIFLSRAAEPKVLEIVFAADPQSGRPAHDEHPPEPLLTNLGRLAFRIMEASGHDMDLEWVVDTAGKIWLLQGRRLRLPDTDRKEERRLREDTPVLEQGTTIFPGRAEGPVAHVSDKPDPAGVKKGAIVVAQQATPRLAPILPHIGGLLVESGNPVGHLAALAREYAVPCLFNVGKAVWTFAPGSIVSMDATKRRLYRGSQWPGLRERFAQRLAARGRPRASGPLHEAVIALSLIDPHAADFKAKKCRSLHDVIRFIHEMSVRSMFAFGDSQKLPWRRTAVPLVTPIPIKIRLINLDGAVAKRDGDLVPEQVYSVPFQALWRGITSPGVRWDKRPNPTSEALPPDFVEQVMGGGRGPRRVRDTNYFIVARDYVNFNARFAFHYAMVDAVASPWAEKNYVSFRFQGGAAAAPNCERRAAFLESVLRLSDFSVDRRADLVAAWIRYYPLNETQRALEVLGRLMACARELDMVLINDDMVKKYVAFFMSGNMRVFM